MAVRPEIAKLVRDVQGGGYNASSKNQLQRKLNRGGLTSEEKEIARQVLRNPFEARKRARAGRAITLKEGESIVSGEKELSVSAVQAPPVSQIDRQRQASLDKGFYSIDPRYQTSKQRAGEIAETIQIKRALPIATRRLPADQKITLERGEEDGYAPARQIDRGGSRNDFAPQPKQSNEYVKGIAEVGKEIFVEPVIGAGTFLRRAQFEALESQGADIEKAPEWVKGVLGKRPSRKRLEPEETSFISASYLIASPRVVQNVAGKVFVGVEGYKFIRQPSPKQAGRLSTALLLPKGLEKISKAKSYLGETKLEFEAFPSEKKIVFVGEGKVRGQSVKSVIVAGDETKAYFNIKGKVFRTQAEGFELPVRTKTQTIQRDIIIQDQGTGLSNAVISETLKTRFKTAKPYKLDLEISDIFRRRVQATPEITKVTEITPKGSEIKMLQIEEPTFSFGKPEPSENYLSIVTKGDVTEVTEIRPPEIKEIALFKRTGKGTLIIEEPSRASVDLMKFARSKKAQLTFEKPRTVVKIEPSTIKELPSFKSIELPSFETRLEVGGLLGVGLLSKSKVKAESNLMAKSIPSQKPMQIPELKPSVSSRPAQAIVPIVRPIKITSSLRKAISVVTPIPPAPQRPRRPKMPEIELPPESPVSFEFDLPDIKLPKGKGRKIRARRPKLGYSASLYGIATGSKATRKSGLFTGLELRGV